MEDPQTSTPSIHSMEPQVLANEVRGQIELGRSLESVRDDLVRHGMDAELAMELVLNIAQRNNDDDETQARIERAQRCKRRGLVWGVGGLFVSGATYAVAAAGGSHTYMLAWGAVLYGAIQYWRGVKLMHAKDVVQQHSGTRMPDA